jgi:hypothetical protein
MAKKEYIEVQKGPISVEDANYSLAYRREPECTMEDLQNNQMRREKMNLTLHEPKR